jgi:hypothetical protein
MAGDVSRLRVDLAIAVTGRHGGEVRSIEEEVEGR